MKMTPHHIGSAVRPFFAEFVADLDRVPSLPTAAGEYIREVSTPWIHDVITPASNDIPDNNTSVRVERFGNNQPGYEAPAVLTYEVSVEWATGGLYMPPEAAIELARHLMEAGAWATRDRARHTDWLLGSGENAAVAK